MSRSALATLLVMGSAPFAAAPASAAPQCDGEAATIVGTARSEELTGTAGDDVIVGLGGDDRIDGRGGLDRICGGRGDDSLKAGPGNFNRLNGDAGKDVLIGGPDVDRLDGGPGNDTLKGKGSPFDTIDYRTSPNGIDVDFQEGTATGEGRDRFFGIEVIFASEHDDTIRGSGDPDVIFGEGGNDEILGGPADDDILGGPGDDAMDGGGGKSDIIGFDFSTAGIHLDYAAGTVTGEGNDSIANFDIFHGTTFDDVIEGADSDDVLDGGPGNDVINGRGGFDGLRGRDGADVMDGGDGVDFVAFNFSDAPVEASLKTGTATGDGTGEDTFTNAEGLFGSSFNDTLEGGDGDDYLLGYPGDDSLDGRQGKDSAMFFGSDFPVEASLVTNTATGEGNDSLADIEGLVGGPGDDVLTGDDEANILTGLSGDDVLTGNGGNDLFWGSDGDDQIDGGEGTFDRADYRHADTAIVADLAAGQVTGEGTDQLTGVEGVGGSQFDDILTGSAGNDFLNGRQGNDMLSGGAGDDFLNGFDGTLDTTDGGDGNDACKNGEEVISCESEAESPEHELEGVAETTNDFAKRNNQRRHTG